MACQGENGRNGVRPSHYHNKKEQNHYWSSWIVPEPKRSHVLHLYSCTEGWIRELLKTISALFGAIIQHLAQVNSQARLTSAHLRRLCRGTG